MLEVQAAITVDIFFQVRFGTKLLLMAQFAYCKNWQSANLSQVSYSMSTCMYYYSTTN